MGHIPFYIQSLIWVRDREDYDLIISTCSFSIDMQPFGLGIKTNYEGLDSKWTISYQVGDG